jgi:hypothetical protein
MNFDLSSLEIGASFRLLMRTSPILMVKLGAYILFWVAALVYLGVTFLVASLIAQAIQIVGVILFIVAIISVVPLYKLAYRYVFFMIKAAHIAVISELLVNGKLPDGANQLEWGKDQVTSRFGEVNAMFLVDALVSGVVRAFTGTIYNVARMLPGDTMEQVAKILNRVVINSTNYIDEAVMSRSFIRKDVPVWVNARDGVVLYGMVWRPLLMNAIALSIISYLPFIVAFLVFSLPVGLLLSVISGSLAGWSLIFTLILAFLIKLAVGDAFAMTSIISAYYRHTQDLTPDPEMVAKLDAASDKFKELKDRAQQQIDQYTEKQKSAQQQHPEPPEPATPAGTGDEDVPTTQ